VEVVVVVVVVLRIYISSLSNNAVDLSKVLGEAKIFGRQKVVITDESMGVSRLLGSTCPGCPKVYAYAV